MITGSTREFSLAQIAAGLPALALAASWAIRFSRSAFMVTGENDSFSSSLGLGVAGDVVEQLAGVAAQRRVGGEQRQVGVDLGRDRVIVAGAEVAVGAQAIALAAHHQRELGVGLVLDEAEDDVDAGALQVAGPLQIGLLVEPGLDLDQGGDVLAVLGRLDQGGDDRAVLGGAVEGLLDGQHIGVARRLADELHHHVEALEGVVDQDVLLADGGEAVAAVVADAFGEARLERRELQVRAVGGDQLGELVQAQQAVDQDDVLRLGVQAFEDEFAQVFGHRGLDLDPHHRAQPALFQPPASNSRTRSSASSSISTSESRIRRNRPWPNTS